MPGWHEATKDLQAAGKVQMVGLIQEQHPDRCKLFMQWKQMDWPIMVDSLNELEVEVVPITLLIDEHGIVRDRPRGRLDGIAKKVEAFINTTYAQPDDVGTDEESAVPDPTRDNLRNAQAEAYRAKGRAVIKWGESSEYGIAIDSFEQALKNIPDDGLTHFQLGSAFRKRYDSEFREDRDFQKAAAHWQKALDLNPNQYIWRRRIQQYGPRLMKPYPFYDWVPTARKEIAARGETPVELAVEPSGAEYAKPARNFSTEDAELTNPDPEGRILRDKEGYIDVQTVVVPAVVKAGGSVRVHVLMTPNEGIESHWNNEAGAMGLWTAPPDAWQVDRQWMEVAPPRTVVSNETRQFELELQLPGDVEPGTITVPAFALYYVCEGVNGVCLYRRQDIAIEVKVVE